MGRSGEVVATNLTKGSGKSTGSIDVMDVREILDLGYALEKAVLNNRT